MFWKLSEDFQENTLGGVILDKRSWNVTKRRTHHRCFLSRKLLKMNDFWQLLLNSYRRLLLMYFNFSPKQFLSAVSFCNVTRNVNKKFLQIALLETTPYKISILVSFLEDVTHYFQSFTQAESTTGLTTVT